MLSETFGGIVHKILVCRKNTKNDRDKFQSRKHFVAIVKLLSSRLAGCFAGAITGLQDYRKSAFAGARTSK